MIPFQMYSGNNFLWAKKRQNKNSNKNFVHSKLIWRERKRIIIKDGALSGRKIVILVGVTSGVKKLQVDKRIRKYCSLFTTFLIGVCSAAKFTFFCKLLYLQSLASYPFAAKLKEITQKCTFNLFFWEFWTLCFILLLPN